MPNHPYSIGDEVLIRGTVALIGVDSVLVEPRSGGIPFEVVPDAITQATPTEPADKSVLIDRHGYSWQRINGEWCQGDVCHTWQYLTEHAGPVKIIHRGGEDG